MEEVMKAVVDNGLGIGSFIALLYFIFTYVKDINNTMNKITDTMVEMKVSLSTITDRIDKIEEKIRKEV